MAKKIKRPTRPTAPREPVEARRRPDYLAFPAFLLLWACIGHIGYEVYHFMEARQKLVRKVNAAVELGNAGNLVEAEKKLRAYRAEVMRTDQTPSAILAGLFRDWSLEINVPLSTIYGNRGKKALAQNKSRAAIRFFILALAHDPDSRGVAGPLGIEAYTAKRYGLALIASEMALQSGADDPGNQSRNIKKLCERKLKEHPKP